MEIWCSLFSRLEDMELSLFAHTASTPSLGRDGRCAENEGKHLPQSVQLLSALMVLPLLLCTPQL